MAVAARARLRRTSSRRASMPRAHVCGPGGRAADRVGARGVCEERGACEGREASVAAMWCAERRVAWRQWNARAAAPVVHRACSPHLNAHDRVLNLVAAVFAHTQRRAHEPRQHAARDSFDAHRSAERALQVANREAPARRRLHAHCGAKRSLEQQQRRPPPRRRLDVHRRTQRAPVQHARPHAARVLLDASRRRATRLCTPLGAPRALLARKLPPCARLNQDGRGARARVASARRQPARVLLDVRRRVGRAHGAQLRDADARRVAACTPLYRCRRVHLLSPRP
eukprot:135187-Prymnesium_polylepis.1